MPSPTEITVSQLSKLIGLPQSPVLVDVREDAECDNDRRTIPGAIRRLAVDPAAWARDFNGKPVVIVCQSGGELSQGTAAWLRHDGIQAETLAGGFAAWASANLPLVLSGKLPQRDAAGRTVWVTRARPKIDRIACPWLIKRFVDPTAVFLFVAPSEVRATAERFQATPFDVDDVFWSHRGERCTFDTMVDEFGLELPALRHLATIVRAADTARLDLAPEAAGLLAISLGYSRMYRDDLAQLDSAMNVYDGLYRWCRDATDETHNWPTNKSST